MRMQLVREGQQWLTRQNCVLTVINVKYNIDEPITVMFEMGGILSELPLVFFNCQVHKLIKDSVPLNTPEYKADLIKSGPFQYNHGEIWVDSEWDYYVVLRTLGSGKNRFHLLPFNDDYSLDYTKYPTSNEINLIARVAKQVDHNELEDKVLLKTSILDIVEVKNHSVRVRASDNPESNVLNFGFGTVFKWEDSQDDEINQLKEDLLTRLWACNDSQDPGVLKLVHEIECLVELNRWRKYAN